MRSSWQELPLGDAPLQIIDGDRGKAYPKHSDFLNDGHCLFLNATNVTVNGFNFSDCQFISEQKDDELRKGKLARNDVVLTTRGTLGNSAYYRKDIAFDHVRINSGMVIIRTDLAQLLPEFVYGFIRSPSFECQVEQLRSGVAQPQLPIRDLSKIKIPLPPVNVQEKIVDVFSSYDALIENNRRRMALLEESARLLYREWFVRLRFPGYEHTRVVDGVPDGWNKGYVSDFYDTSSGGTPSRKIPEYFTGEIPWVKTQELPNAFITDTQEKITEQALKNSSAKLFPDRTVLVALYGATVGEVGILSMPATTNQACCAIIPLDERANFIHAFLFFRENKEKLVNLSAGAAQNNISQQIIRAFEMIMPSSYLMNIFVESLTPVFEQWLNLQRQNEKLRAARDLLLPRLMSGEIPV
jgi:type I restriction enzyme S subunit